MGEFVVEVSEFTRAAIGGLISVLRPVVKAGRAMLEWVRRSFRVLPSEEELRLAFISSGVLDIGWSAVCICPGPAIGYGVGCAVSNSDNEDTDVFDAGEIRDNRTVR